MLGKISVCEVMLQLQLEHLYLFILISSKNQQGKQQQLAASNVFFTVGFSQDITALRCNWCPPTGQKATCVAWINMASNWQIQRPKIRDLVDQNP